MQVTIYQTHFVKALIPPFHHTLLQPNTSTIQQIINTLETILKTVFVITINS